MAAKKKSTRYGKTAGDKVEGAMKERKSGKLRSGRAGKKVTSKKQAIAIGLSEARRAGGKVPPNPNRTGAGKKAAGKKTAAKKTSAKKGAKKTAAKSAKKAANPRKTPAKKSGARKTGTKSTAKKASVRGRKAASGGA